MGDVPEDEISLDDPRAMRALAHPTRLKLLGELRARGAQNVRTLSSLVDEAPNSVSYHLRTLAKYGFVAEAPELAPDARERWWRAVHQRTVWGPAALEESPELRVAGEALQRSVVRRWHDKLADYVDREATLDPEWVRAAVSSDAILYLTAAELAELRDELKAVAARWESRSDRAREDAAQVTMLYHAFRSEP